MSDNFSPDGVDEDPYSDRLYPDGPNEALPSEETVISERLSVDPEVEEQITYVDEPRRIELTIAKIDPVSVLKTGFIISIALGLATVVFGVAVWLFLDGMNVFGSVEDFLVELGAEKFLVLMEYVRLPRVIAYATVLGVVNVVLFTAMTTLLALLYNLIAVLVGGVRVSLMDE